MAELVQLSLFGDDDLTIKKRKPKGGSSNPIVFKDYDSFVAKFTDSNAKTTDDCYPPKDVYEAVVTYVGSVTDLTDKVILRPFYPGGDYENAEYPDNGIVIDNPPFSIFTKICRFYTTLDIPFFLFGPGLTIASACKYCTAVIINECVTFENGASVRLNFASNLYGDTIIMTEPSLGRMIAECPSQHTKPMLPKYEYPINVLSVSDMQTIARNGIKFSIDRDECNIIRTLDCHPKQGGLYGDHFLICTDKAQQKEKMKQTKASGEKIYTQIPLSPRERKIVEHLNQDNDARDKPNQMGDHPRSGPE